MYPKERRKQEKGTFMKNKACRARGKKNSAKKGLTLARGGKKENFPIGKEKEKRDGRRRGASRGKENELG